MKEGHLRSCAIGASKHCNRSGLSLRISSNTEAALTTEERPPCIAGRRQSSATTSHESDKAPLLLGINVQI